MKGELKKMHNNNFFEVRIWKGLIIIPIGLLIVCSYAIIYSIITSGRPISDSGIIATCCLLVVLIFTLILLTLHILNNYLIVQDNQIIAKRLFSSELNLNVHEINEVIKDSYRGNEYYKIIVNKKCVFSANSITCKNYERSLEYFKNHKVSFFNNKH